MKKLLLTLLGVGVVQVSSAATATATFTVNGALADTCRASMSAPAVALADLSIVSTGTTALQVTCRTGTPYTMNVTSANGWKLINGSNSVPYAINYTGSLAGVNSTWSGTVGTTTPVSVTSQNQSGTGVQVSYNLSIVNSIADATVAPGTYSDTVTVNISYT